MRSPAYNSVPVRALASASHGICTAAAGGGSDAPDSDAKSRACTTKTKRRRRTMPLACENCRARRVKCDRRYPCERCVGRGVKCTAPSCIQPAPEAQLQQLGSRPPKSTVHGITTSLSSLKHFDGRYLSLPQCEPNDPEHWLASFKTNFLPVHPILTPDTLNVLVPSTMIKPPEATGLQPAQRLVASLILRLGAIVHEPLSPYADWTSDLLAHATMLNLDSVMELRACLLIVLLITYWPLLEDGSQYRFMRSACDRLQQMMQENRVDLSDPDSFVLIWAFVLLYFDIMPGKFLPFVQPILQQLPWELPSEGLLPPARRMAEIIVKVYSASAISPMPYAEVVASLDKLTNPGSRTLEEASPRVKAQLYAMKVSISQASSGSVHSADEHVEVARYELGAMARFLHSVRTLREFERRYFLEREYEYVMQLARAYDRGLINFEKWTEYSSGLMDFLEKHPKAATKFQLVRNLHSRFVQAQRGAHVE